MRIISRLLVGWFKLGVLFNFVVDRVEPILRLKHISLHWIEFLLYLLLLFIQARKFWINFLRDIIELLNIFCFFDAILALLQLCVKLLLRVTRAVRDIENTIRAHSVVSFILLALLSLRILFRFQARVHHLWLITLHIY